MRTYFSCQPQERLFKVVVRFGRDIIVLQILLSVEDNGLGLDLAILYINFVTSKDDGDVFANTDQIAVPVGHVFVSHARGNVKHYDRALS